MPTTVRSLFTALRADDAGRPRLVWYGADGERVELSARVLENWVAKTANLLREEIGTDDTTRVQLDLPPHWRTAVWTLATWAAGAHLSPSADPAPDDPAPDVVVTTPERAAEAVLAHPHAQVVAVALGALVWSAAASTAATSGPLPREVLDYNATVAGFGDDLPDSAAAPASDLDAVAAHAVVWASPAPALVRAAGYDSGVLLATLTARAGLVILGPGAPDADSIAAQERAVPL